MPTTFQAVAVLVAALLPGALYLWAFERLAGRWGATLTDRVLRFIGGSAILHALFAPITYWFWSTQWAAVAAGRRVSWGLWALALAYVAGPILLGTLVGYGTRKRWPWATIITGPDPAPRAWDYLFQGERDGWVRLKLKSGSWIAGGYATATDGLKSYSAGYPEEQDVFLATTAAVDADTGEFIFGEDGRVQLLPGGVLVRWEEVEYLEFIDA